MNRLIFPNGGMPFELDDLDFMQNAYQESLAGLLYEFALANGGNLILGGCVRTGASAPFNISEGYVMLNYEVLFVPAHTTSLTPNRYILDITYDPAGNDVFFDSVARDTYEVRRATSYVSGSLPPLHVVHDDANRLPKFMGDAILDANRIQTIVQTDTDGVRYDFVGGDFSGGASAGSFAPPYAIKKNGRVTLHGGFDIAALVIGTVYMTLPVSMRFVNTTPADANMYICAYDDVAVRLGVGSNGTIKYYSTLGIGSGIGFPVSLNGIAYDIDN